ncbi:AraC family transcriptional regulator [Pseudotenacibaculum haliotis]|uniref:Helix-turn-helix domain-containing protein n=1 Tax=Pseudotenacibaculum haliotis TaxID=1862138 RepID=A0ABW5LVM8_9FLAO
MDVWSILIIILTFQGLFNLSLLIISNSKESRRGNTYLIAITLLLAWFLLEFLSIRQAFKIPANLFYGTRYGSWLLLGPLTYYFFKTITQEKWRFQLKDSLHVLPFLIFTILIPLLSNESLSHRQIHYGMLAVFDHRPKTVTLFEYLYSTIFYLQFIHLALYLLFNVRMIRNYTQKLKTEYSSIKNLKWISIFNLLLVGILILTSVYLYILFKSDAYNRNLDYIYVVPLGIFIYAISYKLSNQAWLPITETKRYQSSSLKEQEKSSSLEVLEKLMSTEEPYLKNDLRLKDLSTMSGINRHHLSQLINEHYQCSFFDFINQQRVKKAEELIEQFPKKNLLQIAFEAGFNNKTSFVNAFKKFNGHTPSAFRKQYTNK